MPNPSGGAPTPHGATRPATRGEAPTSRPTGGGGGEGRSAELAGPKRQWLGQRLRGTRSEAVEQLTAQPPLADGAALQTGNVRADAPPEPRTLVPKVGLQRWVLPPVARCWLVLTPLDISFEFEPQRKITDPLASIGKSARLHLYMVEAGVESQVYLPIDARVVLRL